MIKTAIHWRNGNVMVFDERGQQVPEYQGRYDDVRFKILRDAPEETEFAKANWMTGDYRKVPRSEW